MERDCGTLHLRQTSPSPALREVPVVHLCLYSLEVPWVLEGQVALGGRPAPDPPDHKKREKIIRQGSHVYDLNSGVSKYNHSDSHDMHC